MLMFWHTSWTPKEPFGVAAWAQKPTHRGLRPMIKFKKTSGIKFPWLRSGNNLWHLVKLFWKDICGLAWMNHNILGVFSSGFHLLLKSSCRMDCHKNLAKSVLALVWYSLKCIPGVPPTCKHYTRKTSACTVSVLIFVPLGQCTASQSCERSCRLLALLTSCLQQSSGINPEKGMLLVKLFCH